MVVTRHAALDAAMKWRQLTFALDNDFDHWICAVAATSRQARFVFHFGALLDDPTGLFAPSDAKFVDDAVVADLLTQALDTLPRFRRLARPS
jgi:hypothetical protein